jgi:hypothetical protein
MFHKQNLNKLAYANGFSLWHYLHHGKLDDVEVKSFFKPAATIVERNDLILVNAQDGNGSYWVMDNSNMNVIVQANLLPATHEKDIKMQIKEIHVGIQRVINLGNYENVRYECSTVVTLNENDDPTEAYEKGLEFCKEKVGAEIDRLETAKSLNKQR